MSSIYCWFDWDDSTTSVNSLNIIKEPRKPWTEYIPGEKVLAKLPQFGLWHGVIVEIGESKQELTKRMNERQKVQAGRSQTVKEIEDNSSSGSSIVSTIQELSKNGSAKTHQNVEENAIELKNVYIQYLCKPLVKFSFVYNVTAEDEHSLPSTTRVPQGKSTIIKNELYSAFHSPYSYVSDLMAGHSVTPTGALSLQPIMTYKELYESNLLLEEVNFKLVQELKSWREQLRMRSRQQNCEGVVKPKATRLQFNSPSFDLLAIDHSTSQTQNIPALDEPFGAAADTAPKKYAWEENITSTGVKKLRLVDNIDCFVTPPQLSQALHIRNQPRKLVISLLDTLFTKEQLAKSNATGTRTAHNSSMKTSALPNLAIQGFVLKQFKKDNGEPCLSEAMFNDVINKSEDYLTDFATKANAQILKKVKEKPLEVPRETVTFDHLTKTCGKRHQKETTKIKESRQQEKDFSPKKKSKVTPEKKVLEKSNLSTCNMLISDIANQFSESQIHDLECAESTVGKNYCLLKSPMQQVLEPVQIANVEKPGDQVSLSVSAGESVTTKENEPPVYTPLTTTWSLCISTYRPDDNPGILFNHPDYVTAWCTKNGKEENPHLYNRSHPDWAPTLKLCDISGPLKSKKMKTKETDMERFNRMQHRQKTREEHDIANVLLDLQHFDETSLAQEGDKSTDHRGSSVCLFNVMGKMEPDQEPTPKTNLISQSVVDSEIQHLIAENTLLKNKLSSYKMNQESFCDNEEKVKYYTGMPSYMTLMTLFEFVAPYIPTSRD
ncbi:hypothetical protein CHS0354_036100 [Potamilus streckersoni]|uniref:BEN domain-containing protein n=1 Tax=Potamilus streckersoni TaxID=2493646 RepID=A0AAE0W3W9_9BIVA|nr:hypothetical protein CHS0354_036100 [Potamilus streckersoni]